MYSYDMYVTDIYYRETLRNDIETNYQVWLDFVKQQEYDELALQIREKRNKMLEETDKEMCIDRLGLTIPEGTSFTAWIGFLKAIGNAVTGDMAKYRQELRDITNQEGFPYNVVWPTKAEKTDEEE